LCKIRIEKEKEMYIVQVHVVVKENRIQDFIEATKTNASNSILEPGVVKFDIIQQKDDPARFILYECYRVEMDSARHKDTEHYRVWRGKVESMMVEPRQSIKYVNVFPEE
jgi:(4S)-4-hydroxy-5-phosphonooxypentane-2,3-dione isomerase